MLNFSQIQDPPNEIRNTCKFSMGCLYNQGYLAVPVDMTHLNVVSQWYCDLKGQVLGVFVVKELPTKTFYN